MFSQNPSKYSIVSFLLYYFLFGPHYNHVSSQSQILPYHLCLHSTPHFDDGLFQHNLKKLLIWLPSNASGANFFKTSSGDEGSEHRVYGLYMCYGYNTREGCQTCVKAASENIKRDCPNATEAIRWEEDCQLRYSRKEFFGALDVDGNKWQRNTVNVSSEPERFGSAVVRILGDLAEKAALERSPNKYAFDSKYYDSTKTLYAVAQCTGDLSPYYCKKCLDAAIANVSSCCSSSIGARILSKSCYLRYETYKFYEENLLPKKGMY